MEQPDIRFRQAVVDVCAGEGITPPRRIRVSQNPVRRASATAFRFGRLGSGFIVSTQSMIDDLDDEELGVVVRHELAHYRHAEARWAPLQALAGLSPLLVVIYGWPLAHAIGKLPTVILYFVALIAHVLAFKSKRFFEARADRESVRSEAEARAAQQALLKFGTLKERSEGLGGDELTAAFAVKINEPPNRSDLIFNWIWGVHPMLRERLAIYELYADSKKAPK